MPLLPKQNNNKYTQTKNIGKVKNTGFIFNGLQKLDNIAVKSYYDNSAEFLATTTAGFVVSNFDLTSYIASESFTPAYILKVEKPVLQDFTRPFTAAGAANAQIDKAITVDLTYNDTIRVVAFSNYPAATMTYRLASDTGYANSISWNITGSSVNIGTATNPLYKTVEVVRVQAGTLAGTPDLTKIIRSRFISTNSTATNKVTPTAVYIVNNYSMLPGSLLSWKACCVDEIGLKREIDTATLKCGQSVTGETITSDKFTFTFKLSEESPDLLALAIGSYSKLQKQTVWNHLSGYEPGQTLNKVIADVVGAATRGQIQLSTGLSINSVIVNCANLSNVDYTAAILTNANGILGTGQYSYDTASGIMYFNTANIGDLPEITSYIDKDLFVVDPEPNRLGHTMSVYLQDTNSAGKTKYYFLKNVQLKFPDMSVEDEGNTLEFELTAFFSKRGDVVVSYDVV
jgi:hypothetical protein